MILPQLRGVEPDLKGIELEKFWDFARMISTFDFCG